MRRLDPDRYLLAMLAPENTRAALFSIYAFNTEIARIRESVSEALLGHIRLQWWRDALEQTGTRARGWSMRLSGR